MYPPQSSMAKDKTAYVCSNCGQESPKWIGKCPACGQWNTFKEIRIADTRQQVATSAAASVGHALRRNKVLKLNEIPAHDDRGGACARQYRPAGWRAWHWQVYADPTDCTKHARDAHPLRQR